MSIISILFPLEYMDYIVKYAEEYGVDPLLVSAIINVESRYDKDAVSPKECQD